jgi:hypothetical protein
VQSAGNASQTRGILESVTVRCSPKMELVGSRITPKTVVCLMCFRDLGFSAAMLPFQRLRAKGKCAHFNSMSELPQYIQNRIFISRSVRDVGNWNILINFIVSFEIVHHSASCERSFRLLAGFHFSVPVSSLRLSTGNPHLLLSAFPNQFDFRSRPPLFSNEDDSSP